ncbi:TetR/AcrR family transcriptional regulator [Actinophytocola oryzae]|uniref:TetR family transcriptional regulator n=1 Tax=Actinophytocola oryzae TaxID=502181 RepID=A0A4R7VQZ4_9PSEU|nr:TetR/AcrR family transcriptional regulator [Actinophytocola oryzae]TDV52190.1 TetR family transcriptional regulator [Actinophytocola oryzae]
MTAAPRRRRLEPDERREQILACAIQLFGEHGYATVSTTELARQAGVARGLINHYFGTKRDLYLEVVRRLVTIPRFAVDQLPVGPLEVRVDAAVDWFLDGVSRNSKAWLAATGGWDPDVEHILAAADETAADRVLAATGLSAERVELRAMVRSYGGMVKSACREWLVRKELSRAQVKLLLSTTLLTLIREAAPRLGPLP